MGSVIEVLLHRIVFSTGAVTTLSVVAQEGDPNCLQWAVATQGRTDAPLIFFNESAQASLEFRKRCGEALSTGALVESNTIYGSLNGFFTLPDAEVQRGYRVIKVSEPKAQEWRASIKTQTLKLEPGEM